MSTVQQISEIELDQAVEETSRFEDSFEFDNGTIRIVSGNHPDFGSVYMIIPPMGKTVILPSSETIVSQLNRA